MKRLESLQVLRAFAALMVVVLHATNLKLPSETAKWRFDLGAAGVDLFFVLSGVIIYLVPKHSPGEFLRRRIERIVPLYFLLTLIALPFAREAGVMNLLVSLTFWPAWGQMTAPALGVGWSLCFEMLFYLAAAAIVADRRMIYVFALGYPACMGLMFTTGLPLFQFLGNPIVLEFTAGVLLGHLWKNGARVDFRWSLAAIATGIIAWALVPGVEAITMVESTLTGGTSLPRAFLLGGPAALIVWGFLNLKFCWPAWLVETGDASYSIYLAHAVALTPLAYSLPPPALRPYSAVFYVLMSALAGFAVYQLLERPILEWTRRTARARYSSGDARSHV